MYQQYQFLKSVRSLFCLLEYMTTYTTNSYSWIAFKHLIIKQK